MGGVRLTLRGNRGGGLVTALLALTLLSGLALTMVGRFRSSLSVVDRTRNSNHAVYIARAGFERASLDLLVGTADWSSTPTGLQYGGAVAFGGGEYEVQILAPSPGGLTIESKGRYHGVERTLRLDVVNVDASGNPAAGLSASCRECDGKAIDLTLRYDGSVTDAHVVIEQDTDHLIVFDEIVQPGEQFSFIGLDPTGIFGNDIEISVDGVLHTTIKTDCSDPIGPCLVGGDFYVVKGRSLMGGPLCPIVGSACDNDCHDCDGKVTDLTLRYDGTVANAQISIEQEKDHLIVFDDIVQPGEEFTFIGLHSTGIFGSDIEISIDGTLHTTIKTDCSDPIGPCLVSGDFYVVEGTSLNGGTLCPIIGSSCDTACHDCDGKVTDLTLRYEGAVANAQISIEQEKDHLIVFDDIVQPGEEFTFIGLHSTGIFGRDIEISIDGTLHTTIKTDCSDPIGPCLTSDDFTVVAGRSLDGGELCPIVGSSCDTGCHDCDGKATDMVLRYDGSITDANVVVVQEKDNLTVFDSTVQPGEQFSFVGLHSDGTFGNDVEIFIDGMSHVTIKTDCNVLIGPCYQAQDFTMLDGSSRYGGALCPVVEDCGSGGFVRIDTLTDPWLTGWLQ